MYIGLPALCVLPTPLSRMVSPYADRSARPAGKAGAEDLIPDTNPIESVFSTLRHCNVRMKGALSQATARLMVFKLVTAASKNWRRLKGQNQLPKIISGVKFRDGIEAASETKSAA